MRVFLRLVWLLSSLTVFAMPVMANGSSMDQALPHDAQQSASAYFAGGCFWCMEPPFDKLDGVSATVSGYMGGEAATATYKRVSSGSTKHVEVIKVDYDPARVSYETLLEVFWRNVDPLDAQGQFCDKGPQYKSYIYTSSAAEKQLAQASLATIQKRFDTPVATKIVDAMAFYPAEAYHQNYYQRNPLRYKFYRSGCGRDRRLEALWGQKAD